ncbi:unnamed protein product [Mytilus edulis]|uniref:Uncharacterized protein n=1 Tax=Mytilus edulis TaxID=6550 RepID=A0A8S3UV98_MYTED|nr:unnamed protein product [Mytilus edulis]
MNDRTKRHISVFKKCPSKVYLRSDTVFLKHFREKQKSRQHELTEEQRKILEKKKHIIRKTAFLQRNLQQKSLVPLSCLFSQIGNDKFKLHMLPDYVESVLAILKDDQYVHQLDLSNTKIDTTGSRLLSELLTTNKNITTLVLNKSGMCGKRLKVLVRNGQFEQLETVVLSDLQVDEIGICTNKMEITYLLLSAIFERNELLNLSPSNIITALEIIWPDIHVPRVDSLKRHMLKVVSRCDKSSDLLNQKVSLLYTNCNVKFTVNGRMTNRDFLSMFTAMSKHHTIHEIYMHILPNFKLESPPSSVAALRQKYKKLTELRDKLQKNQKNYDLEHLLNSNFILPTDTSSTKQPNLNATKRKLDTFRKFQNELSKVGTEMQNMESELEISSEIAADFKLQYEMALDEIYELQTEIDVLVRECNNNDHTIHSLKSKLFRIESKYKTQSAKLEETNNRFNYHELRKFQKRESYHKKVICSQKNEIKKLKLDIDKSKTVEAEKGRQ